MTGTDYLFLFVLILGIITVVVVRRREAKARKAILASTLEAGRAIGRSEEQLRQARLLTATLGRVGYPAHMATRLLAEETAAYEARAAHPDDVTDECGNDCSEMHRFDATCKVA